MSAKLVYDSEADKLSTDNANTVRQELLEQFHDQTLRQVSANITRRAQDDQLKEYNNRDAIYTSMLRAYVTEYSANAASNRKLKRIFFWFVLGVFIVIVLACAMLSIFALRDAEDTVLQISAFATSLIGIITAMIKLPEIIAEYLFPKDEHVNTANMIQRFQENDDHIRAAYNETKKQKTAGNGGE